MQGSLTRFPIIRNTLKKEWRVITACIVISALLWFFQSMGLEYRAHLFVDVEYSGVPNDLVLTNKPADRLDIYTKGKGWDLLGYKLSVRKPKLNVNLEEFSQSASYPTSRAKNLITAQVPGLVDVLSVAPETLNLEFDKKVSKTVPIEAKIDFSFKDGFGLNGNLTIMPDSVEVSGPSSVVSQISSLPTLPISLSEVEENISATLLLEQANEQHLTFNTTEVQVNGQVEKLTEKTIHDLPIRLKGKFNGKITLIPSRASLRFKLPISAYKAIDESHFSIYASIEDGLSDDLIEVKVETKTPIVVQDIFIEPRYVNYIITE